MAKPDQYHFYLGWSHWGTEWLVQVTCPVAVSSYRSFYTHMNATLNKWKDGLSVSECNIKKDGKFFILGSKDVEVFRGVTDTIHHPLENCHLDGELNPGPFRISEPSWTAKFCFNQPAGAATISLHSWAMSSICWMNCKSAMFLGLKSYLRKHLLNKLCTDFAMKRSWRLVDFILWTPPGFFWFGAGSGRSLSDHAASGPHEPRRLPLGRWGTMRNSYDHCEMGTTPKVVSLSKK